MTAITERRVFGRVAYQGLARITCAAGIAREAHLFDLSLKGALLQTLDGWRGARGERCQLQLDLAPGVSIRMKMTVVHEHGELLGLHCDDIDLESITNLRRLVELNAQDPALLERDLAALVHEA